MARYRAVRGTFDLLPKQVPAWVKVENTARDLAHRFGFREIRTPLFEQAELYTRGMGVMSGLIEKELWAFQDKFGQKLALRADMTTGVVRAYQEHKLYEAGLPQKMFYLAPVFLLGKEGEERSRQSHQFGFEALGSDSAALDAEVIALAASFCDAVGIEGYTIRLNSLGGADCRPVYQQKLRDYFGANQEQLCPTCKRKFKSHPDWVLSCEEQGCKTLAQVAPTIYGMLSNGAKQHFAALREYLEEMELPVELDPRVVRDSEYYNRTVFEVRVGDRSLGFGGRYDSLVEKLGGKSTPAVGFAMSMEAVLDVLADTEDEIRQPSPAVYFQPEGPESSKLLVPLLNALRQRGVSAELDYRNGGKGSAPSGCSWSVILDESNAFRGHAILRDLSNDKEEKVAVGRLRSRVLTLSGLPAVESGDRDRDRDRDGGASGRKKLRRGAKRREDETETQDERRDDESEGRRERRTRKLRRNRGEDSGAGTREPQKDREPAEARERDKDREPQRDRDRDRERDKDREPQKDRDRDRDRDRERDRDKDREPEKTRERDKVRDRDKERDDKDRDLPRERDRDRERSREKKPARERGRDQDHNEGDGKAIVPAFNLGGLGQKLPTQHKVEGTISKGRSPEQPKPPEPVIPKPLKAPKPAPSSASGGALSLNWSILPGKESGKGNGKSPVEKGGHAE